MMTRARTLILGIVTFMMVSGSAVASVGVWDGINGPEVSSQPTIVQAEQIVEDAPNPDQPVIVQPSEDESKPSDFLGPGLTLAGSGGAIGAAAVGVSAPGGGGAQPPPQEPIHLVPTPPKA